ncbi:MAG: MlrC C-terminal domain-containing protein [Deinococcales bacterium]
MIEEMTQRWPQEGKPLIMSCGDSVALHCQGVDIIVNSKRSQCFSPDVFSNFGIDIRQKRIVIVKSTQHFYAGFKPVAAEILYMATPGAISPIMEIIPFEVADINKYPWVDNPFSTLKEQP